MRPNPQETTDLVTFTEEIRNEQLHFLCSEHCWEMSTLREPNLGEDTYLEEEFIVILPQIMSGISTDMISLNLSVLLFMAQWIATVRKFSG